MNGGSTAAIRLAAIAINESAGVFAEPIHQDHLALSIRVCIGGRHMFADGVLVRRGACA